MQDALYPNLRPWRVISNESRLLFIVFKIGLVEQGIKQDLQIFIDFWQRDEILVSNDKELYYKTKDKINEKISVEIKNNKNLDIKKIIDVK